MISVFRLHIATPILVLGIVDILILYLSIAAGYSISYLDLSLGINTFWSGLGNGTLYVSAIVLSLICTSASLSPIRRLRFCDCLQVLHPRFS